MLAWLKKNTRVGVPLREHGQSRIRKHALIWVGPGAGDTLVRPIQKFMLGFRILIIRLRRPNTQRVFF